MIKRYALLILLLISSMAVHAQCSIDSTQTDPGIYPDTLQPAVANQFYNQDITFVMITDTLGLTINNFHLASVTGLPAGMTWQCNNFSNNCNYNPSVSIYGCVNLNGTPLVAGTYSVTVTVIATLQIVGDQTIPYTIPFIVVPDTVSNPGFSMTNSNGCAPLTVSFSNNDPGQSAYLWDFGNGIQSNLENPPSQIYNVPGNYVVTQTVTASGNPQYFLTDLTVASIPDNYGAPVDVPDMYFFIYDSLGSQIYDSRPAVLNTNAPHSWALPNIPLQNGNYTMHVWDEDGGLFGADDDLGSISFQGWSSSGTASGTLSGVSGSLVVNYTILEIPVPVYTHTDTVHVFANPSVPVITSGGPLTFCDGDSVVLTCNDTNAIQWYVDGNMLIGETGSSLSVNTSGDYSVIITNSTGCTAQSVVSSVIVNPNPPKPTFYVVGNTLNCVLSGYMLQWYFQNNVLTGETGQTLNATQQGTYFVTATDSASGCSTVSDTILFTPVSATELVSQSFTAMLSPNPAAAEVLLTLTSAINSVTQIQIMEMTGKLILQQEFNSQRGITRFPVSLNGYSKGLYLVRITQGNNSKTLRLAVH
ncbi:MAG: hypothetical protein FNNCIFGK_00304 [Bacteroidia bacterium]|nr:hypothetical protein [Bacteroidia bacterium]MCE7954995.1 T9SS C-terminal target domain-containing protein [Bacteroidetes bacterium CHB6]